jgi:Sulfotransferase family
MAHADEGSEPGLAATGRAAGALQDDPQAGRPPDFLIVGHQKCGTTALYKMLRDHPQIYMSAEKEPRFFIEELRPAQPPGRKSKRPAALEDYLLLFAGARDDQLAGEASPQYLRYPEVPGKIAELRPEAKIIALLREPTSFLRSFHGQMVHGRIESEKDFQKAMQLEPARRRGERLPPGCRRQAFLLYSDHVRYRQQLEWFHASFPREQVLVLIYEDYRRDNETAVREVLRFLEVDDTVPIEQNETDPKKDVRIWRLHDFAGSMRQARRGDAAPPAVRLLDAAISDRARKALSPHWRRFIYRPRSEPDAGFVRELRRRFKPEVQAVSEYLERDLVSQWGYDRID